jgi:integrase
MELHNKDQKRISLFNRDLYNNDCDPKKRCLLMVTIEEFLRMFRSENTRKVYKPTLTQYFDVLGITPSEYFNNGRRYEDDVVAFLNDLEKKGRTSKSIATKIGAVRSYLLENEVELPRRFWKRLKINGIAVTQDRLFTKQELRMIFSHLDILGRAVAQVQLSTGLRIEDVLKIRKSDLKREIIPARFRYMNHKIHRYCVAFLTTEAKTIIEEWLKVRESWCLQNLWMNNVYRGFTDLGWEEWWEEDNRNNLLFPISRDVVYYRWWMALDASGLNQRDPTTNRRVLHTQTFRKYFRTFAGTLLEVSVVEALTGHSGGLNDVQTIYNRYGSDCEESLAKDFLKIEHLLSLGVGDVHVETEMEKMKKLLENQQEIIDELVKRDLNDKVRTELERKSLLNRKDVLLME